MTGKIGRPCAEPRCPRIVTDAKRYCDEHAANEKTRGFTKRYKEALPLYDTKAWKQLRVLVLSQHQFCEECRRQGMLAPARVVHHLKSAREHPDLALVRSNLEALCDRCHNRESQAESMIGRKAG